MPQPAGWRGAALRTPYHTHMPQFARAPLVIIAAFVVCGFIFLAPGYVRPDSIATFSYLRSAVFDRGAPSGAVPALEGAACRIELELGLGEGCATYLASDLSYEYVRVNAEYRT